MPDAVAGPAPDAVGEVRRFVLPDLGEGLTEAEIVAWRVAVGDAISLNQVLVEVETEKAVVELPSPYPGIVQAVLAQPGDTVAVGAALVVMEVPATHSREAGEADQPGQPDQPDQPDQERRFLAGSGPLPAPPRRRRRVGAHRVRRGPPPAEGTRPLAAPPVRFMARQHDIDLAQVTGHGPGGVITREDLAAHLAARGAVATTVDTGASGATGRESRIPVRGVHKRMAEAMVRSVASAPQACVFLSLDVTPTVELVERLRANRHFVGIRMTPLTVVAHAVVLALRTHPSLNSSWDADRAEIVTKQYVNLGVAVAGPTGLVVPNVKDAHTMTLRALGSRLNEVVDRARAGRCTPADFRDGTVTVTNVGVFGVDGGVPLLNPGEAAILAFGAIGRRPWEHEGQVALRDVVTLSVAFDHRLVDGESASRFLGTVGEILSDPTNLLALA